ncbi:hypothetical protein BDZ45DRAFT_343715 [Acephala macrosclerotiorum]|nr:hypothetical protein BDZ45DRAFT_343715 [Acephala macrosclerotiorum]
MRQPVAPSDSHPCKTSRISAKHSTASTHLPSCSDAVNGIASRWWEEAAQEVLKTSSNFNDISLVLKFIRFQDPDTAIEALSGRQVWLLDAWLSIIYGNRHWECSCECASCKAKDIVEILNPRRLSPVPVWNGEWIFRSMSSPMDVTTIAQKLDVSICTVFLKIPCNSWISWALGYGDDDVSNFYDAVLSFRDRCAQYLQKLGQQIHKWKSLAEALQFLHPSGPLDGLSFLVDAVTSLFTTRAPIIPILKRLSILHTRFEDKIVRGVEVDWHKPFSTEFSLLDDIERCSNPEDLAKPITDSVAALFCKVSIADVVHYGTSVKAITTQWSKLSDDVMALFTADPDLTPYLMKFVSRLIFLGNLNSATAVGSGLSKAHYQPAIPTAVWALIDPKDDFAAAEAYLIEAPIPILPYLRQSGYPLEQVPSIFRFVQHFGQLQGAGVGQGATINRYPPSPPVEYSCAANQLKRKAALDLNEDAWITKKTTRNQLRGSSDSYPIPPRNDIGLVSPRSSPEGSNLRTTLPPDPTIGEQEWHQVVVQDRSPLIQRDQTTRTGCSSPSPTQSSTALALCQLSHAACAVSVERDDGEIVGQDLIEVVDEDVVMGGEKEDVIQQSPMVASRTAPVKRPRKRPRGRPRKHPIQKSVSQPRQRTKTGCFTCRKRKKKCDEAKPSSL